MQLTIVLGERGGPESYVRADVMEADLKLSPKEFDERYVLPAVAGLLNHINAQIAKG